jgi:hypothetical protein
MSWIGNDKKRLCLFSIEGFSIGSEISESGTNAIFYLL